MATQILAQPHTVRNGQVISDDLAQRAAATALEMARILILNEVEYLVWQERTRRAGEQLASNV
jgi:hypothetical protein